MCSSAVRLFGYGRTGALGLSYKGWDDDMSVLEEPSVYHIEIQGSVTSIARICQCQLKLEKIGFWLCEMLDAVFVCRAYVS